MKQVFGIIAILTSLVACTAAEEKELEASDAMEAKARTYCNVTQGYEIGQKTYMGCKEHYMQGLMDAAKAK
jgi:hypothetical protein